MAPTLNPARCLYTNSQTELYWNLKMKFSETRPSKYLKASDLEDREIILTMDYVEVQELYGQDAEKPVLFFRDTEKALVLNVTNGNTIAGEYGDEMDSWSGKPIIVYPDRTDFGGKRVPCLRVKIPAAPAPANVPVAAEPVAAVMAESADAPF